MHGMLRFAKGALTPKITDGHLPLHKEAVTEQLHSFYGCASLGSMLLYGIKQAKRGTNEIATNVFFLFLFFYTMRMSRDGYRRTSWYSDVCGGQNKNRINFCMYTVATLHYQVDIVHKFLETCHTQNEVDSMHARIETEEEGKISLCRPSRRKKIMRFLIPTTRKSSTFL